MTTQNSTDFSSLQFVYNDTEKTLTINDFNRSISLHEMKDIFFGDSTAEGNLSPMCDTEIPYQVKDYDDRDLDGP